jgi:hypothetical protein
MVLRKYLDQGWDIKTEYGIPERFHNVYQGAAS